MPRERLTKEPSQPSSSSYCNASLAGLQPRRPRLLLHKVLSKLRTLKKFQMQRQQPAQQLRVQAMAVVATVIQSSRVRMSHRPTSWTLQI